MEIGKMNEKARLLERQSQQIYNSIPNGDYGLLLRPKRGTPLTADQLKYYEENKDWRLFRRITCALAIFTFIALLFSAVLVCYFEYYYNCYPPLAPQMRQNSILVDNLLLTGIANEQNNATISTTPIRGN